MKKILLIGLDPDVIDYTAPHVPKGASAAMLVAELTEAQQQMTDQGDQLDICNIQLDGSMEEPVTAQFTHSTYDCILIGSGIRKPDEDIEMFERIIHSIRHYAPNTPLGFVPTPLDSVKAVARVMLQDVRVN